MSNVFDQTTDQSAEEKTVTGGNPSYIEQLVAAKGETWKDPEIIAKGKLESDQHIANLERQLKEMTEDFTKKQAEQDYAKKLLEELQNGKPPEVSAGSSSPKEEANTQTENTTLDPSKLEELIHKTLDQRTQAQIAADNVRKVDAHLSETYGTEAGKTVQAKAQELGLSVDYLKGIAEQSPDAFFNLMGTPKPQQSSAPPKGSVNAMAAQGSGDRTYAYYRNLRKENPSQYYKASVQQQLMKDAEKAAGEGKDFFQT